MQNGEVFDSSMLGMDCTQLLELGVGNNVSGGVVISESEQTDIFHRILVQIILALVWPPVIRSALAAIWASFTHSVSLPNGKNRSERLALAPSVAPLPHKQFRRGDTAVPTRYPRRRRRHAGTYSRIEGARPGGLSLLLRNYFANRPNAIL